MHIKMFYAMKGILLCKKLAINRVLKWFEGLIDLAEHTARDKQAIQTLETYRLVRLRVKPGLTSCEDLATALSLGIDNKCKYCDIGKYQWAHTTQAIHWNDGVISLTPGIMTIWLGRTLWVYT